MLIMLNEASVMSSKYWCIVGPWQVTPLQLATVYSTIASGGVYHKPYLITRINAHDGRVLEEVKVGASFSLLCAVVQRATYSTRICLM